MTIMFTTNRPLVQDVDECAECLKHQQCIGIMKCEEREYRRRLENEKAREQE